MTQAFQEYRASSATVTALLSLESGYKDPPTRLHKPKVEGLRGGSVVLMVALFEHYLKEAVGELLESINDAQPPCDFSKLPLALQMSAVYTGLDSAIRPKYQVLGTTKKDKKARLSGVLDVVEKLNNGKLISDSVANTAGNPNHKQVTEIFKNIGYDSVFSRIKPEFDRIWGMPTASTYVENTLDKIVMSRHVVAHTASVLAISRSDVAHWLLFLDTLVTVFDVSLVTHINAVIIAAQ